MSEPVKYFDIDETNDLFSKKNNGDISIIHLNAVSLVANFDSIIIFLENLNFPDIVSHLSYLYF